MTYHYTDPDGDELIIEPAHRHGRPAISLRNIRRDTGDGAAVHVLVDQAEDLVAGIRSTAAQAATRTDAAVRAAALREAGAVPDFFRPGHTYARQREAGTWLFKVAAVADSPDGLRTALGFLWGDNGPWVANGEMEFDGWQPMARHGTAPTAHADTDKHTTTHNDTAARQAHRASEGT